jgi:hypothetical protein
VALAQTQGVAEDGYLSGATIYADANGNLSLDPGEASTTADSGGNFTLVGGTGTLVATGGMDATTGLPFTGVLEAPAGSTVISPLTTIVAELIAAGVTNSVQKADAALGLPASFDLSHTDPAALAASGDATGQAAFLEQAGVADAAALLAAGLTAPGALDAVTAYTRVMAALASSIAAGQAVTLTDAGTIAAIGTAAGLGSAAANAIGTIVANASAALTDPQNTIAGVETRAQGALAAAVTAAAVDPAKLQALASASSSNLDLPPTLADDAVNTVENTPLTLAASSLLANDSDPDGDALSITGVKDAIGGQASFDAQSNTIVFSPASNFSGSGSFVYSASDGKGSSADAKVSVSIAAASIGGGQGDVHYTTFDGLHYDLQATGEFLIARATSGPALQIEGRAEGQRVSYLTAVSIEADGHDLLFDAKTNGLSLDGSAVSVATGNALDLGGFSLTESSAGAYMLSDSTQDIFNIFDRGSYFDLSVQPGSNRARGSFEGLLGNFDGNPLNDLALPGQGAQNSTTDTAYLEGPFADAWRVPVTASPNSGSLA